jgi:hypothetical protein
VVTSTSATTIEKGRRGSARQEEATSRDGGREVALPTWYDEIDTSLTATNHHIKPTKL